MKKSSFIDAYVVDVEEFVTKKEYDQMMLDDNKELIDLLNKIISLCEPVKYEDFNVRINAVNVDDLRKLEKENPKVGICKYDTPNEGVSTLSLVATITDVLINKRLSFVIDDDGFISGVKWYKE
jgi:hypothetical protein